MRVSLLDQGVSEDVNGGEENSLMVFFFFISLSYMTPLLRVTSGLHILLERYSVSKGITI